jgi:hypothetical protein
MIQLYMLHFPRLSRVIPLQRHSISSSRKHAVLKITINVKQIVLKFGYFRSRFFFKKSCHFSLELVNKICQNEGLWQKKWGIKFLLDSSSVENIFFFFFLFFFFFSSLFPQGLNVYRFFVCIKLIGVNFWHMFW